MNNTKKIYIGFTSSNSWISSLIRFFTNSKTINHAYIAFDLSDNIFNGKYVINAYTDRILLITHDTLLNEYVHVEEFEFEITTKDYNELVKLLIHNYMNMKYDIIGVIGIAIKNSIKFITGQQVQINNPFKNKHKMFCSELTFNSLRYVLDIETYKSFDNINEKNVEPDDLYKMIKKINPNNIILK